MAGVDYCTVSNIQSNFVKIDFSTDTTVTSKKVKELISDYSNQLDSRLSYKYVMPVVEAASPSAFAICKQIVQYFVTAEIEDIITRGRALTSQDSKPNNNQEPRSIRWNKRAEKLINQLENGELTFIDVQKVSESKIFSSNTGKPQYDPVFRKECDQW